MQEQYFNGIRFTIGPGRKYFSNSAVFPKSMHCYVWSYYNGEIPKGYDIHHKDGNRYNNDISNLECIERHEHRKLHGKLLTDEERQCRRDNINTKARPKAIEWHKSEQGKIWHKEQVLTRKDNRQLCEGICQFCGKKIIGYNNQGHTAKFCSNACAQKYRRRSGVDKIEVICMICGKSFMTGKGNPAKTCSKSCANKLAWMNGKTINKKKGN